MQPVEYRAVIRFLYLNGRTPLEIFDDMKATYGEDAPSYDVVKHWHRQFRHGRTSVETAPIPGRPQSAIDEDTIHQVEIAILEDRSITVRQLAQVAKISVGSVDKILHDHLHMQKLFAQWVPSILTPFQKQERVQCSKALLAMYQENKEDFFDRLLVITQDDIWVHDFDPETNFDSPPPKKARVIPSACKFMLTVFWDQHGVVMMDVLSKGTTITGAYYTSLIQKLQEAIKTKRHRMLTKGVCLLQDNAPVHISHIAQMEALSCGYDILPHPPYSPDLAPSNFHLFPPLKSFMKGKRFEDDETLISEVTSWLQTQPADFYKQGVHSCLKRWKKCITLGGTYVEEDQ